ncbi:hypothetical protein [Dickeya fangzhongdai]|uniref:hypothetical protein n=1 Tax=Dickeya fangzhongdai TaxID=1778540 RepID=UPI0026DFC88A|nr:hypothetical protein [Dickeya fangzhongdai]WKV51416.1 hypothetical protein PL145_03915 [Dickeya fangzhongdai]
MISSKRPSSRWLYIPLSYRTLRICCVSPGMQAWSRWPGIGLVTRRTAIQGAVEKTGGVVAKTGRVDPLIIMGIHQKRLWNALL